MSIGFIGGGVGSKKSVDVFNGNASAQIDVSMQNVLSRYDVSRTDLDRLVDSAQNGTFDITSKQHYGMFQKDSVNGWAETWYAEYRAVLALRADALQKKLQASYNRVLERSAYAEIKEDNKSIFAPYANRTFSGADVSYKMPVAAVLMSDIGNVAAGPTPPPVPTATPTYNPNWQNDMRAAILAAAPQSPFPNQNIRLAQAQAAIDAVNDAINFNGITDPVVIQAMIDAGQIAAINALTSQATQADQDNIAPWTNFDQNGGGSSPATFFYPNADGYMRTDLGNLGFSTLVNPYPAGSWPLSGSMYATVRMAAEGVIPPPPGAPTATPGVPGVTGWSGAYQSGASRGDNPKLTLPMFGAGDIPIDFSNVPREVYDTLLTSAPAMEALNHAILEIQQSFYTRQYQDIVEGNRYDASTLNMSMMIYPGPYTIETFIDTSFPAGSIIEAGSKSIIPAIPLGIGQLTIGPDLYFGHLSAISDLGGFPKWPSIGMSGTLITIPIPYVPITLSFNVSYDLVADLLEQFFNAIKTPVVEAMQIQAYSASSGTAFDTYASRGEYHFTEPGISTALDQVNFSICGIPINFSGLYNKFITAGAIAPPSLGKQVNQASVKERIFEYKHTIQAEENRETETGAFFATNAFLSQFELNNMESEYWVGTQQNEELVNTDLVRAMSVAGKEFLGIIAGVLIDVGGSVSNAIINSLLTMILSAASTAQIASTIYKLMYEDTDLEADIVGQIPLTTSKYKSEGYDYIENDHKPFEGDSDFNYAPSTGPLSFLNDLFDSGTPDFILDGYANTRRFRKKTGGAGGAWSESVFMSDVTGYNQNAEDGVGPRGHAGRGGHGQDDGTFWNDTDPGDINEVFVGTRKVTFNNLKEGFGEFTAANISTGAATLSDSFTTSNATSSFAGGATRNTEAKAYRYTGADSRIFGRRYDAADPVNFETFNVGLYTTAPLDPNGSPFGVTAHYDRKNQYSMKFTPTAQGQQISLFAGQALNPTFGGFIKMSDIDKNKEDDVLIKYDQGGMAAVRALGYSGGDQQFGAAPDETLNELNQVLYEHMHLRQDGRNLSTIREYRDVFDTGLMKNVFVSGQTYHPSGGGITSSIEIRYDSTQGNATLQANTREFYDVSNNAAYGSGSKYDPYNTPFLTKSKGKATVYLNTYFSNKKRASNKKT